MQLPLLSTLFLMLISQCQDNFLEIVLFFLFISLLLVLFSSASLKNMRLLLLFVVYYVSLIITLICCAYLADSYFLVDLFLQHFPVVESSVTPSCL